MSGHLLAPRHRTGAADSSKARAPEKLASLVESGEVLTTTRSNVAEPRVGAEGTRDRHGELVAVETMLEPLPVLDFRESSPRVFWRINTHLYAYGSPPKT